MPYGAGFTIVQPDEQKRLEAQNIHTKMLVRILEQGLAELPEAMMLVGFTVYTEQKTHVAQDINRKILVVQILEQGPGRVWQ